MPIILIIFGLYVTAVGYNHNATPFISEISHDAKTGLPWIAAVIGLLILYKVVPDTYKPMLKGIFILAALGYLLKGQKYVTLVSNTKKLINGQF